MITRKLTVTGLIDKYFKGHEGDYGNEDYDRVQFIYDYAKDVFGLSSMSVLKHDEDGATYSFDIYVVGTEEELKQINEFINRIESMKSVRSENLGYNNLIYKEYISTSDGYILERTNEPTLKEQNDSKLPYLFVKGYLDLNGSFMDTLNLQRNVKKTYGELVKVSAMDSIIDDYYDSMYFRIDSTEQVASDGTTSEQILDKITSEIDLLKVKGMETKTSVVTYIKYAYKENRWVEVGTNRTTYLD